MARDAVALTDGGIETSLSFHEGFDLPCFASFPLLADARGRAALRRYFEPFLDTAQARGLPFVLDTVTWRANPDWGARLGYDEPITATSRRSSPPGSAPEPRHPDGRVLAGVGAHSGRLEGDALSPGLTSAPSVGRISGWCDDRRLRC